MLTLHELQQEFINNLKAGCHKSFFKSIKLHPLLSPALQFEIYANGITGRFQKILLRIYPVCLKLVGKDFFIGMATGYIETTSSHSPDLNTYGGDFASFVATYTPAASLPYLADIAALEWAWQLLYTAPIPQDFDFLKLSHHTDQDFSFSLCPNSTLLSSCYPLHLIWEMNQATSNINEALILKDNESYYFFIWQSKSTLNVELVNHIEWRILNWIQNSIPLTKLCSLIENHFKQLTCSELFPQWISKGWITDFRVLLA